MDDEGSPDNEQQRMDRQHAAAAAGPTAPKQQQAQEAVPGGGGSSTNGGIGNGGGGIEDDTATDNNNNRPQPPPQPQPQPQQPPPQPKQPTQRACAGCGHELDRSYYSDSQWASDGLVRCISCSDNGRPVVNGEQSCKEDKEAGRFNESNVAKFDEPDLRHPFAEGSNRWAARGVYIDGPRKGMACVCKWFKTGHVLDDVYYEDDIRAMHKALELVERFNKANIIENFVIKVNIPEVWQFCGRWAGRKALQEPYIKNYQRFNSNSGWFHTDRSNEWADAMQALSHFSYHISNGNYLLCDLQGGIYGNSVVLTDPCINSRELEFGTTDLGPNGISTFFSNHRCNRFCRRDWRIFRNPKRFYNIVPNTTMDRDMVGRRHPPPNRRRRESHGRMLPPPPKRRGNWWDDRRHSY